MNGSANSVINNNEQCDVVNSKEVYVTKSELTGAYVHALSLLVKDDLLAQELPILTTTSMIKFGEDIYRFIVQKTKERQIGIKDELINNDESDNENALIDEVKEKNTLHVVEKINELHKDKDEHSYSVITCPETSFDEVKEISTFNEIKEENALKNAVEEHNYFEDENYEPEEGLELKKEQIEIKDELIINDESDNENALIHEVKEKNTLHVVEKINELHKDKDEHSYSIITCPETSFDEVKEINTSNEIEEENALKNAVEEDNYFEDENYEPEEKKYKKMNYIPIEMIIKTVECARKHPNWSIRTLQSKGCSKLRSKQQLRKWEQYIKSGGTIFNKYFHIESRTLNRFKEARKKKSSGNDE